MKFLSQKASQSDYHNGPPKNGIFYQSTYTILTYNPFSFPFKPKQDAQAVVAAAAPGTEGGKSKAELKAERRAKQEAQRAAKAASAEEKKDKAPAKAKAQRVPDDMQVGAQ